MLSFRGRANSERVNHCEIEVYFANLNTLFGISIRKICSLRSWLKFGSPKLESINLFWSKGIKYWILELPRSPSRSHIFVKFLSIINQQAAQIFIVYLRPPYLWFIISIKNVFSIPVRTGDHLLNSPLPLTFWPYPFRDTRQSIISPSNIYS